VSGEKKTWPKTPWAQWRAFGIGVLGWSPDEFWRATPADLMAARDGLLMKSGQASFSDDEVADLRAGLEKAKAETRRQAARAKREKPRGSDGG
jgi:hypothetical protein